MEYIPGLLLLLPFILLVIALIWFFVYVMIGATRAGDRLHYKLFPEKEKKRRR